MPRRLRSRMPTFPKKPFVVENPAPNEISPVERSLTLTCRTVLSGREPTTFLTSTFSKNPKFRIFFRARRVLEALNASPSTNTISRRITESMVRTLPVISIRSTKTRGPSRTRKVMSMTRSFFLRFTRGRISTNAYPSVLTASVRFRTTFLTTSALYQSPFLTLIRPFN